MVEFKTFIAEIGLTVSTSLCGFQRLRRLTKATHDGNTPQAYSVPVPKGHAKVQGDKMQPEVTLQETCKPKKGRLSSFKFVLLSFQ